MNLDEQAERERDLVNRISLVFEMAGLPPVSGRIIGHLMLCDPAHQSSTQLADYLHASKGAISTQTRALMMAGLIEKVRFPGDRASYFRIAAGCWPRFLEAELRRTQLLRMLGDEALTYLGEIDAKPARAQRMREFRDFSVFCEQEFPVLMEHWANRSKK